jgi:hypothetical protein
MGEVLSACTDLAHWPVKQGKSINLLSPFSAGKTSNAEANCSGCGECNGAKK